MYNDEKGMAHERQPENHEQPAIERQPSEMDLVVKSLFNHLEFFSNTIGLLEQKVILLDDSCSRVRAENYPKNMSQKAEQAIPNKNIPTPDRDGLMGKFDRINEKFEYLNKRLACDFSMSLQIVIDHLQQHI